MSQKNTFVQNGFIVRLPDEPPMQIEEEGSATSVADIDPPISVEEAFQDMVTERPIDKSKPLVVLDGANIGWAYGDTSFYVQGLKIALDHLSTFPLNVVTFIPSAFLRRRPRDGSKGNACMQTDDWTELQSLVRSGAVTVVPAGDHDDVYILHYARTNNGFVISNDFYADHIKKIDDESIRTSMTLWLAENRCGYTFVRDQFLLNPASPLGLLLDGIERSRYNPADVCANSAVVGASSAVPKPSCVDYSIAALHVFFSNTSPITIAM
jgi:hypothetical protein